MMPRRKSFPAAFAAIVVSALIFQPLRTQAAPPKSAPAHEDRAAERKAILDTLRAPVERELKQKVVFRVTDLRTGNGWAFIDGEPLSPAGERLDYSRTKYAILLPKGTDAGFYALLRRDPSGKGWTVVHYAIGAEDVIATEPLEKYAQPPYGAPRPVLFGDDPAHTLRGAERKAVLDTLRGPVERDLKQKVVFQVDTLRAMDGWAFLTGVPLRPDGGTLDYHKTRYQAEIADGTFDNNFTALLRRQNGKWTVVEFVIGATDVCWDGWDTKYRAPRALFPYRTSGPEKGA